MRKNMRLIYRLQRPCSRLAERPEDGVNFFVRQCAFKVIADFESTVFESVWPSSSDNFNNCELLQFKNEISK